tara:strand:+ start:139 stop:513 length:375 start_codon:yes stop_codon:yes gene_type:complete
MPKGRIASMQSIITNKNTVARSIQLNTQHVQLAQSLEANNNSQEVISERKVSTINNVQRPINVIRSRGMFLKPKQGHTALEHNAMRNTRIDSDNYNGTWMNFMYRDPSKPRGGCGACYKNSQNN